MICFTLVWFGLVWVFVVRIVKLCQENYSVKFEYNQFRNAGDITPNVLRKLDGHTQTHTHTQTHPRTTRNPVSQHYRVGLEKSKTKST